MIHPLAAQIQQKVAEMLDVYNGQFTDRLSREVAITSWSDQFLALLVGSGTPTPEPKDRIERRIVQWRMTGGGWAVENMAELIEDLIVDREFLAPHAPEEPNRDAVRSASPQFTVVYVEGHDGKNVAAPCQISGCQYDRAEWQPIESAPKDGTPVLVFDEGAICMAAFDAETETWIDVFPMKPPPTHWMPLPSPPQEPT